MPNISPTSQRLMPLAKEPATPQCPIPPNFVAFIGGTNSIIRAYILWKDGQTIVIEARPFEMMAALAMGKPVSDPQMIQKADADYYYHLEIIHSLIDSVEFGRTNWAHLVQKPAGGYTITQRNFVLQKIQTPTWAPLVDESDITFTSWWDADTRLGFWKGQEVEILVGWDNFMSIRFLDRAMAAYRYLEGLDLAPQVLGHVIRDGEIIGLMMELREGRMLQYRDRSILYDAVSRMEQRNLLHASPDDLNVMASDGKICLINLACIFHYPESMRAVYETKKVKHHWGTMEQLFENMDKSFVNVPFPFRNRNVSKHTILPKHYSPERPLRVEFLLQIENTPLIKLRPYRTRHDRTKERIMKLKQLKASRVKDDHDDDSEEPIDEKYLNLMVLGRSCHAPGAHHQSRSSSEKTFRPYHIPKSTRKLLLASGDPNV